MTIRFRAALFVASCVAGGGLVLEAQGTPIRPLVGQSESEIVASAEREGVAFPVDSSRPARVKALFTDQSVPGNSSRRCVPATGFGQVRSGDFVINGRLSGPRNKNNEIKVAWGPMHHQRQMQLVVRGRLVGADETTSFESSVVAHGVPKPGAVVPEAEREYFFPSGVKFASAGRWVLVATQASDWGCFVFDIA
jgi:hypothetical protein